MYKHFFKRVLDILISSIALLLIGWFLILVAIFLHFANKGAGAFFLQERSGFLGVGRTWKGYEILYSNET
jgi:lipopolysaccharide/colanic/teichoic acid biosynthesis glycosyltransferase